MAFMGAREARISKRLARLASPYLRDGEEVTAAFPAWPASPLLILLSPLGLLIPMVVYWVRAARKRQRVVVVTNERIIVFAGGRVRQGVIHSVLREVPRTTIMGPAKGLLFYRFESLGESLWVPGIFQQEITISDSAAGWSRGAI